MIIFLSSCNNKDECVEIPASYELVHVDIQHMESVVLNLKSKEQIKQFMLEEPVITEYFLRKSDYPNDSIFIHEMYRRFNHPTIDSLNEEIKRFFGDYSQLQTDFDEAFTRLHHYYPEAKIPKIKTVATGFDFDMLVSDTLIVIGLDYYMGDEAKYRPRETYNYILRRYQPKFIVPSAMLIYGISNNFNKVDEQDETILSDMIAYGKSFYFAKQMIPCTPDSTIIWYSDVEMNGITENADIVWSYFIQENLLWESSHIEKRKYLDERPKTYEIGPSCPPRVGTWLGWEIVKKYMEDHPDVTLPQLMSMSDAKDIFDKARYRPKK